MRVTAPSLGPRQMVENPAERTGLPPESWPHVVVSGTATERPPRPAWISDALLARTIELWSRAYRRPLGESDALEILENVGRLAEALLDAKRRMRK